MPAVEDDVHLMEDDSDSDDYSEAGSDEAAALAEFDSEAEEDDEDSDDEGRIDDAGKRLCSFPYSLSSDQIGLNVLWVIRIRFG